MPWPGSSSTAEDVSAETVAKYFIWDILGSGCARTSHQALRDTPAHNHRPVLRKESDNSSHPKWLGSKPCNFVGELDFGVE